MHSTEHDALIQLPLSQLELTNPFWQFSLEQWKKTALQAQLLELQNTQQCRINLLLLAMWLGFEHVDIRPHLHIFVEGTDAWHQQVVTPLRKTRQSLPGTARDLKKQVQASELQAEQIEQALLYSIFLKHKTDQFSKHPHRSADSLDWLIINLAASGLAQSDLSLLIQNCLPGYPVERINERIAQHGLAANKA